MTPGVTITRDETKSLLANILKMASRRVLIGIPADSPSRDGETLSNAAIGYLQENGSTIKNIPPRPFLIPGVEAARPRAIDALEKYAGQALSDPETIDKGLHAAGMIARDSVKQRIISQEGFEVLSDRTLKARRKKGFKGEKALIRTGQLLNSISYVVGQK